MISTSRSSSSTTSTLIVVASLAVAGGLGLSWYYLYNIRTQTKENLDDDDDDALFQRAEDDLILREVVTSDHTPTTNSNTKSTRRILTRNSITIVHGSVTGTTQQYAQRLYETLLNQQSSTNNRMVQLASIDTFDWWDELLNVDDEQEEDQPLLLRTTHGQNDETPMVFILLPTYTNGAWPPTATLLRDGLQELINDWRISKFPLAQKLSVAVFGMGSSEYDDNSMGRPAKEATKLLYQLGAKIVTKLVVGDDAVGDSAQVAFEKWQDEIVNKLSSGLDRSKSIKTNQNNKKKSSDCCGNDDNGDCCKHHTNEKISNDDTNDIEVFEGDDGYESEDENQEPAVIDLEDMGDAVLASNNNQNSAKKPHEMVTPSQAKALKKEGYKLIGTHSAVKLCRWTKHQLRGRGGCYKHTFYGITSYQCMEATPSLACANKCVFCWRHHKNPVGKTWRWKTDDPKFIVKEAVKTHVQMIKETRGIPGVQVDRWKEAHTVRHCALSLVGEPIMYPRINELLGELHQRQISTFLVTNGQHPAAIDTLRPITQLYVSVDAPTQESLIAIDRPLFNDAWDRLKESLSSLKHKGQRTVARLTVVKGWNFDEIAGYAELIALGKVSLVEVKGVTFCGKSDASNLNMTNTPWHHEVVELTRTLKLELSKLRQKDPTIPEYDLACEHRHSVSVLLARVDQFSVDANGERKWRTWIDYEKFQQLAATHAEDPSFTFTVEDYTAETPTWALFGAQEEGFDPSDKRHRKNTKHPKYTQFDSEGIPTHDEDNKRISEDERRRLRALMNEKKQSIGEGSTVTELRGGEKVILDASNMFRGMVVAK